jgi:hypothetical protein
LEEVVTKAITEKCKMVLCVPVWVTEHWWKILMEHRFKHVFIPSKEGIYWNSDMEKLVHPHWKSALFLIEPNTTPSTQDEDSLSTPTIGLDWLDPLVLEKVQRLHDGKGWSHLTDELSDAMHKFANIMVTLRSGKLVEERDDVDSDEEENEDQSAENTPPNMDHALDGSHPLDDVSNTPIPQVAPSTPGSPISQDGSHVPISQDDSHVPTNVENPPPPPPNMAPKFKFWHMMTPEEQAERLRLRKKASKRGGDQMKNWPHLNMTPPPNSPPYHPQKKKTSC